MSNATWRKQFAIWRNRLYLYPAPDPMPHTRLFWLAMGLVTIAVLAFASFFILFLTAKHNAYLTAAEDLGNMDQAVWSVLHGQVLHQTICNIVSDTNCYSPTGISRFAIHFEPMLFLVSLFYVIWPDPKTLLVLQTLVVASGAFPAFWLARLRLRNELAAVGIAVLYLLYPVQQQATIFEFHAVTLTAALLLFTFYFMYTRRTLWLFVFAVLAIACKEEIAGVIALLGLWSIIFQQRWRSGLGLVGLALAWLGLELLSYHFFSPTGHPLLASRYAYLGSGPLQIAAHLLQHPGSTFRQFIWDRAHRQYLITLLAPAGFLPLLAPWVSVLAVPSVLLNLLSNDPNQYSGLFQYSAEIVPILIFSTIEAIVLIVWAIRGGIARWQVRRGVPLWSPVGLATESVGETGDHKGTPLRTVSIGQRVNAALLFVLIGLLLANVLNLDTVYGAMPYTQGFGWPQANAHTALAQHFIDMIPQSASVSAQSSLVPHISQRTSIYLFPYDDDQADYIFLDITSTPYPFTAYNYTLEVKNLLFQKKGNYGVRAAEDGYLLLHRGLPAVGLAPNTPFVGVVDSIPNLPDEFCSFTRVSPQQITHPLQVNFTASAAATVSLVGFHVTAPNMFTANPLTRFMQITAYWKVNSDNVPPLRIEALLLDKNGKEFYASIDFPASAWCPSSTWEPGTVLATTSSVLYIGSVPTGLAHVALALLPFATPFGTIHAVQDRLPLHIVSAPAGVTHARGTNALQLDTFTIGP